jgi:hypothetical protein
MLQRRLLTASSNTSFLAAVTITFCAHAQTSPTELAQAVVQRWSACSPADFAAIYPFREGRDARSEAVAAQFVRAQGLAKVIRTSGDHAVLLLSGVPVGFNSGDDTISGRRFSGLYAARREDANSMARRA